MGNFKLTRKQKLLLLTAFLSLLVNGVVGYLIYLKMFMVIYALCGVVFVTGMIWFLLSTWNIK